MINDEQKQVIIENGKTVTEWSDAAKEAAAQLSKDLSAALGVEADLNLSPDFIEKNKGLIEEFVAGSAEAGEELQQALYDDALNSLSNIPAELKDSVTNLHNYLTENLENQNFEVGVSVNDGDFFK
jgi:uncharacterized protein YgfB (UPF0149 family)